jgi:hypothetical protein
MNMNPLPKDMTTETPTLEEKIASNTWDSLRDFLEVAKKMQAGEWNWYRNSKCKYVELRVDMRTLHCIIKDRNGNRIDPKDLAYQYDDPRPKIDAILSELERNEK